MNLKLWGYIGATVALSVGLTWFGVHERSVGASGIQAAWDTEKAKASDAASRQAYAAARTQSRQLATFADIAATYHEPITDEKPSATTVTAGDVSSGRIRLRDEWQCASGYVRAGTMSKAAVGGHGADAATAVAAEQRSEGASDLVRIADNADERERRLDAQVSALQSILDAERSR